MAQTYSPTSIMFNVQRGAPELVTPAKSTPYEFKPLSDLDNLYWFRTHVSGLTFYPHNPSMNGVDPSKLIRTAIAQTLVFYYPLAGRLREGTTGKLTVECTGEGILFAEADADVTLDQFGYPIVPPFSFLDQLLYQEPTDIFNCPLMLIQVTRLKCGGFVIGLRHNHTMCDAVGAAQFLSAIGEIARGAISPSVLPVWERHVLNSTIPQQPTSPLPEHNHNISDSSNDMKFPLEHELCYKAFIFAQTEISALRRCLPIHLRHCSSFEIVTASVWKCRVAALQLHPTKETSLIWSVNLRGKLNQLIPSGYYGNAVGVSISTSTAKDILESPLSYALQLLRNSKRKVNTEDYEGSVINLMASMTSYTVTDLKNAGFGEVDFGWNKPIYAGLAQSMLTAGGYQTQFNREKGENEIMLPVCLPKEAMERFEMELNNMLKDQPFIGDGNAVISKL
ncbi:benzyl alcohol O-benzoyltransferase-like [Euphorbia lathyris]|uniref:benzyl alcohol O-benzoyltransferase-like n=1 Tax=Euphorbia lathyris TaxID=212925 RepID=UPI0033137B84